MAWLTPWIAPVFALAGVAIGAFLNPWGLRRQSWLTARREAFDQAITAVKAAELARYYPRHVDPRELGPDLQRALDFNRELPIRGFERLAEAMHEMHRELAALEPFFQPEWESNQWPITDETAASLVAQLKRERQRVPLRGRRAAQ
ncbi:hypothetical protein [Streptomyces sp. NPDC052496]|uniref:hypothetical protein n=1 Tax=Streptomyces sp. NPDC052496 TaxID=3154951 RepID=UPI0034300D0B